MVVGLMQAEQPNIEVTTTATSYPLDSYRNYKDPFTQLGCVNIGHSDIRNRVSANDEEILKRVKKCDGVMFSGGVELCKACAGSCSATGDPWSCIERGHGRL